MGTAHALPRSVKILRWIARMWSTLVFGVALLVILTPDPTPPNQSRLRTGSC